MVVAELSYETVAPLLTMGIDRLYTFIMKLITYSSDPEIKDILNRCDRFVITPQTPSVWATTAVEAICILNDGVKSSRRMNLGRLWIIGEFVKPPIPSIKGSI